MKKHILGLAITAASPLPPAPHPNIHVPHLGAPPPPPPPAAPGPGEKGWGGLGGGPGGADPPALNVLKGNLEKQGVKWNDMPVAGGGGEAAMTVVRARVTAGNPPTA